MNVYYKTLSPGLYDIKVEPKHQDFLTKLFDIDIPRGFYTPKSLIFYIQQKLREQENSTRIGFVDTKTIGSVTNDVNQNFLQIQTNAHTYLQFDPYMQELLHLNQSFITPNSVYTMSKPFALVPDSYNIIIYCSILKETVVGGQPEKILSISPVEHNNYEYGKLIAKEFSSADYYRVNVNLLHTIEIEFCGDTGEYIPIHQGRSYVKLHFRKGRPDTAAAAD